MLHYSFSVSIKDLFWTIQTSGFKNKTKLKKENRKGKKQGTS